jgi:hypothetical protein
MINGERDSSNYPTYSPNEDPLQPMAPNDPFLFCQHIHTI